MAKSTSFNVTYDADSDVLYISKQQTPAARGVEDQYGFLWRYDGNGELIGLTVTDFQHFWHTRRDLLADEIANHFHVSALHAHVVLDRATAEDGSR